MRPTVYIETTIPSFYFEVRTDPESVARRNWTQEWWDEWRDGYNLVTSQAVLDELEGGEYPTKPETMSFTKRMTFLPFTSEIATIVQAYISSHVMPNDPAGDALHLAIASFHRCDYLLTWNCRHLANGNKWDHIQRVNKRLGLLSPGILTPLQLMGEVDET